MAGNRRIDVDLFAAKADILHDIVADTISSEVKRETGIECSARENMEIRVNMLKMEELVKRFDLNNTNKEVGMYDNYATEENLRGFEQLSGVDFYNEKGR